MMEARKYTDFKRLPSDYERLFGNANIDSFFQSLPWFENLIDNGIDHRDQLQLYCIRDGAPGGMTGILPMRVCNEKWHWGTPVTLQCLANYYTPVFEPVIDKCRRDSKQIVKTLILAVCDDPARWDAVDLKPLSSELPTECKEAFREAGWIAQSYFCFGNWFLPVEGRSYKDYFSTLPSPLKHTIIRKRKKLQTHRLRLDIMTSQERLDSGIDAYHDVYMASWKRPEPYRGFMAGLIRTCAKHGVLRLGVAYIDGRPAAAQVWIVDQSVASIYKLAYRAEFSQYSVGSILTAHMMEYVIDVDRVREVDYLIGDDAYKKSWMSARRERWGVRAFNPQTIRGLFGIIRHLGGNTVKRTWHKLLGGREDWQAMPPTQ